jgi:hypothetical protein
MAPTLVGAKIYLQKLWRQEYDWDTPLSEEHAAEWDQLTKDWCEAVCSIPRLILVHGATSTQLHVFTDASKYAYCAAIYLRVTRAMEIHTALLMSRNRVAPIAGPDTDVANVWMPRMELLSILLGTTLLKFVQSELDITIDSVHLWNDNQPVLWWIAGYQGRHSIRFVQNQLAKVKKNFAGPFHYVPTEQNPADLATRGIPFSAIPNTWFEGPQWLSMPEAEWPQIQCASFPDEEETQTDVEEINLAVVQTEPISTVIDPTRVQHWRMLKNVTKHVLRFLNIKLRGTHPFPKVSQTGLYSASDDRAAELLLIRHAQLRNPPELKEQQRWSMAATSEGVLRCFTRMELNEERPMLANPIFLPPNDPATELIVMHGHRKLKHQPVSHLVLHLRQQFFIPRSRQTVKRIVDSCCKVCHVWDAKPAAIPPMEPLPKQRMRRSRAFEHIGLDYMGPRMVKTGRVAKKVGAVAVLKGGQDEKIWIMLATCMATRAVYLDCIRDLSAKTFLNALRRLIADLGTPSLVVSDNAPQFALADATLKEVWRQTITDPEVTAYFATNGITWRYITAYNPREGGFYERLNAMVKRCLKRAVGRRILDNDEMQTFIREVAAILNARPLVAADDDLNSYVAVRPIDFVVPYAEIGLPSEDDNSEDWLPPSA